jgi:hypothetical protein
MTQGKPWANHGPLRLHRSHSPALPWTLAMAKAWADVSCRMHKFQIVPMFPPGARWDFWNLWKRPDVYFESICCLAAKAITLRSLPLELMLECSCITPKDLRNWTLQCPKTSKHQDNPRQHRRTYSWHFMTQCFFAQRCSELLHPLPVPGAICRPVSSWRRTVLRSCFWT